MKPEDIYLYDWHRILYGQFPAEFYIEILIRAAAVFLILMGSMRLMGRRMSSQLSRNEMAAMVSMAAAVGVPILDAQRGLLPAAIIALVVVFGQRTISSIAAKNQKFEAISQDDISTLVENSTMCLTNLTDSRVTRELLFAQLRSEGILHLGQVKRLYMEANGTFTLIEEKEPKPGLSVLPGWDEDFTNSQKKAPGVFVCNVCGHHKSKPVDQPENCDNCTFDNWGQAIEK